MVHRYCLLDLETVVHPDAAQWLPVVEADKRLTDPQKIADDVEKKRASLLESAPLDGDLNRIVCFGLQPSQEDEAAIYLTLTEDNERDILDLAWNYTLVSVPFVGYGLSWFDLGVMVRRSQLLGVTVPDRIYEQGKYRHPLIIELADRLTLNGMIEQKKGRGLDYHCRRLGIDVADAHSGKDTAALWKAGDYSAIGAHCLADMQRIRLLAQRLGVIPVPQPATPLTFEDAF